MFVRYEKHNGKPFTLGGYWWMDSIAIVRDKDAKKILKDWPGIFTQVFEQPDGTYQGKVLPVPPEVQQKINPEKLTQADSPSGEGLAPDESRPDEDQADETPMPDSVRKALGKDAV